MAPRKPAQRAAVPLHPPGRSALQTVPRTVCHTLELLPRSFRNLDDLNAQFTEWRTGIANPRTHATTRRVVDEAFAEELPSLRPLPALAYDAVLTVERRVSNEGMVSVGGNLCPVPDTARHRVLELQHHTAEIRIFEERGHDCHWPEGMPERADCPAPGARGQGAAPGRSRPSQGAAAAPAPADASPGPAPPAGFPRCFRPPPGCG
ncbi:hypothetical protein [Poseidonocella sp. HB161398]|uniref:Mu transposase domain-containing protein n=1 Tax=Poseidonocella sp. HB161398 TaxID=2320855 RepID=UPI00197D881C